MQYIRQRYIMKPYVMTPQQIVDVINSKLQMRKQTKTKHRRVTATDLTKRHGLKAMERSDLSFQLTTLML